ncbi:MAG: polyprenyl synthetase family protein [Anaerolineae bacterium]|nr:polyprenyl synthetase family protein [Anaerolineae bacterium]
MFLVYDDVEDNSPTRRHRPTVWALATAGHQCRRCPLCPRA